MLSENILLDDFGLPNLDRGRVDRWSDDELRLGVHVLSSPVDNVNKKEAHEVGGDNYFATHFDIAISRQGIGRRME